MRHGRLVVVLSVLCVLCSILVHAAPAEANHVVTVTPDSDLSSGDVVTLQATGLTLAGPDHNTTVAFCQALIALGTGSQSCGPTLVTSSDGNGNLTRTYQVHRFIAAPPMGMVDCVVVACGIQVVDFSTASSGGGHGYIAPITFRPAPFPGPTR